jgi:tetraacyldisaccharide 4'-kinase
MYGAIIFIRNKLFDWGVFRSTAYQFPVISIGNITVGGTGKTPHIEYLVRLLSESFQVGTLSRGYKRKTKGWRLAEVESSADEVGDEPLQIKRKFPQAIVAVDADRRRGIKRLREQNPYPEAILLDDAFQHRKVSPSLSILLVDYQRPIDSDHMLPWGDLREQAYEKRRAGIILVTKCPKKLEPIEQRIFIKEFNPYPYQKVFFTTYSYADLIPVFPRAKKSLPRKYLKNLSREKSVGILLVTGIANPQPMVEFVNNKMGGEVTHLAFPDHHQFTKRDFLRIQKSYDAMDTEEKFVITTEKDAMRLHKFCNIAGPLSKAMYYLPIRVKFLDKSDEKFNKQLIDYVRENKVHSFLHPKQSRGNS